MLTEETKDKLASKFVFIFSIKIIIIGGKKVYKKLNNL